MESNLAVVPDPEVPAKAERRRFTAAQKARILAEYERASTIERAAMCRRERIYSSHISNWRKEQRSGRPLEAQRGRKPDPQVVELTRLRRECESLQKRLAKAERVIDVQGKAYALLRAVAGESADQMDLPPWSKRS
jgi:transposase